jgi:uncharacterized protein
VRALQVGSGRSIRFRTGVRLGDRFVRGGARENHAQSLEALSDVTLAVHVATLTPFPPRRRVIPAHLREIAAQLASVLEPHSAVALAYVFGSVARGEARPGSDLDVGIVFARRGETARDHVELMGVLAAQIEGVGEFRDVDLVVLETQGPIFCQRVVSEGVLVYERDPERRVDFESDTIVRALDFRPTYELAARGQVKAFRRWLRARYDLR